MSIEIFDIAERLKSLHKSSDPFELAECLGLRVRFHDLGYTKGLYFITRRCRFIFVNENISEKLQRIVVAHEIGHDRLHRELAKLGQLSEFSLYDMTSTPEREANIFAANILLDDNDVEELARLQYTSQQIAMELCVPEEMLIIKMIDMNERGYRFRIPYIPRADFLGR